MPPTPLLDRLVGLIAWLTDRLAGTGKPAGGSRAAGDPAPLDATGVNTILARLGRILARFRAVAATPIPPPKPAEKPPEPRFIPTHILTYHPIEPEPEPPPPAHIEPPSTYRWLLRVAPHLIPGRTLVEDFLRDADTQAALAADYRLGPILRPLAWMLGVDRALLPASRLRRRLVILVPGGRTDAAAAAAEYAAARADSGPGFEILTLCYPLARKGRDRRPVWRGSNGLALPEGVEIWC